MLRGRVARNPTASSYGLPYAFASGLAFLTVRALAARAQASLADLCVDLRRNVGVLAQELLRVLATLTDALLSVVDPRTRLVQHAGRDAHVDHAALARDALVRQDLDLGDPEGWRDLVLHHLHLHATADDHVALLDRLDRANVDADRGVELQRSATRSGLGIPEHDSDLLTQLGDEDDRGRRLAGSFGAKDLDDAAAREAADAEREIHGERAGRNRVDLLPGGVAELHDRALPELLLDLLDRLLDRSRLFRHCHLLLLSAPKKSGAGLRHTGPAPLPSVFSGVGRHQFSFSFRFGFTISKVMGWTGCATPLFFSSFSS